MYHLLQEGIVDDVISVGKLIVAARDGFSSGYNAGTSYVSGSNKDSLKTYSYSSAAKAASNLICVFPVLTSRTVSADTAQKVSKYIEQKGCIILQMALQAANISNAKNGIDYLRNFHQNLNIGGDGVNALTKTLNAWIDGMDTTNLDKKRQEDYDRGHTYRESVASMLESELKERQNIEVDDSAVYESDESIHISPVQMNALLKEFADAEKYNVYDTQLNPMSIEDYYVNESDNGTYNVEIKRYDPLNEAYNTPKRGRRDSTDKRNAARDRAAAARANADRIRYNSAKDAAKDSMLKYQKQADEAKNDAKYTADKQAHERKSWEHDEDKWAYEKKQREREEEKYEREREKYEREELERTRSTSFQFMKDQDIKKMNNAVPSLLIVRFYSDSKANVATEFIIGVKSKVIGCNSDEILRRIANNNKDGRFMVNLLRTVSGELKKSDFLFGISRTQEDLMSINKKGSHGDTWALLQSRALAAKQAVKQGRVNDYSAITTVVISQSDADDLYKEENLDITNPSIAKRFMQSYNLLGFIIVDDATESLKMLFDDGDSDFEEVSYMMLDRETDDKNYKKLINLIASSR